MSKCIGCGIKLQSESKDLPGYVKDNTFKYCRRCFRNINYSEVTNEFISFSNEDIIKKINKSSDLTFFVTDFININSKIIELYNKITTAKYLVINKTDIIPKDIKENKIIKYLNDYYNIKDKVIFTSKRNNNIFNYFEDAKNIYFCGVTNSGKSTLISNVSKNTKITKSYMINTTLDFIKVKYNDILLFDSPGFIINTNIINNKDLKIINPTKRINVRNYQVKEGTVLNFSNYFKIEFLSNNIASSYISNGIIIKKEYMGLDDYQEIEIPSGSDLIIYGYGFINIKNEGKIRLSKDLIYEVRNSIF